MPTLGWIAEGDFERVTAATQGVPDPAPGFANSTFQCPFCSAILPSQQQLGDHLSDKHVGARPFLSILGKEPPKDCTFNRTLLARSIQVLSSTAADMSIDGEPWCRVDLLDLADVLAKQAYGRLQLHLSNKFDRKAEPVVTEYDFRFRVISNEDFERADRLFVKHMADPSPTLTSVDRYLHSVGQGPVLDYAGALADYVVAVLKKDTGTREHLLLSVENYRSIFNGSLRILQEIDRPLPRLLCALMRFGMNNFSLPDTGTSFLPLQRANRMLRSLEHGGEPRSSDQVDDQEAKRMEVCPIDAGTDIVLRQSDHLASLHRWSKTIEDNLRAQADLAALDPLDRVKIQVMWAYTALRLGNIEGAKEPLRRLDGNDRFGPWAAKQLKEHNL